MANQKTIITIGRQFGSGGHEIGATIAQDLGIKLYDKEILNQVYKKISGFNCENYIRVVVASVLTQISQTFPKMDQKYVVEYIQSKAGQEKDAYINQLKFMKDIIGIEQPTDLDYRNSLYEIFEKVTRDV